MALLTEADLKLNITAIDQASKILNGVKSALDGVTASVAAMAKSTLDPFANITTGAIGATAAVNKLYDALESLDATKFGTGIFEPLVSDAEVAFSNIATSAKDTARAIVSSFSGMKIRDPFTHMASSVYAIEATVSDLAQSIPQLGAVQMNDPLTPLLVDSQKIVSNLTSISQLADSIKTPTDVLLPLETSAAAIVTSLTAQQELLSGFKEPTDIFLPMETTLAQMTASLSKIPAMIEVIDSTAARNPFVDWTVPPNVNTAYQNAMKESQATGGKSTAGSTSLNALSGIANLDKSMGHLMNGLLMGGMNAMMVGYLGSSLASGANNLQYIQQIQTLDKGTTNEAAQSYAMLGTAGMKGAQAPQFLSQLSSTLRTLFNPTSNNYSTNEKYLSSLGITSAYATASPMMALQGIGGQYRNLMGAGNTSAASQLLSLTGTSSMGALFENWNTEKQSASSINMGMTSPQLNASVKQDLGLQMNLQKLSLAFDQLSVSLVPVINRVVKAFTDLANGLSGKLSIAATIGKVANDLGALGTTIVATVAIIKAAALANAVIGGATGSAAGKGTIGYALGAGGSWLASKAGGLGKGASALDNINPDGIAFLLSSLLGGSMTGGGYVQQYGKNYDQLTKSQKAAVNKQNSTGFLDQAPNLSVFTQFLKNLPGDVQRSAAGAQAQMNKWNSQISTWSSGLYKHFAGGVSKWYGDITKWASGLWSKVWTPISLWPASFSTWASGLWNKVWTPISLWPNSIQTWASSLINSFNLGIASFATGIRDWFAQLWASIQHTATLAVMQTGTAALGAAHSAPIVGGLLTSPYAQSQFSTDMFSHNFNHGNLNVSGKASGGHVISINITGGTLKERQNAKVVADQIVQSLKMQGNFDLSY